MDPSNERLYIALDNYYDYLKITRVSELQSVAQSLGAKHFKVSYKEQTESYINKKGVLKGIGNYYVRLLWNYNDWISFIYF